MEEAWRVRGGRQRLLRVPACCPAQLHLLLPTRTERYRYRASKNSQAGAP